MNAPVLKIERLAASHGLDLPAYETSGAAGMDLRAAVDTPLTIAPGERVLIPTGLVMELPRGHEGQVRPRSGLAIKHGITLINSPGTIDEDYRGEVMVPLVNHGTEPFEVTRGMRIAQLVVAPVVQVRVEETTAIGETRRGDGGFGSTGKE